MEYIKRALRALSTGLGRITGASLGFVLTPLSRLSKLTINLAFSSAIALGTAVLLTAIAGYWAYAYNGIFSSLMVMAGTGLLYAGGAALFLGFAAVTAPFVAIYLLLVSPFQGLTKGWDDGFVATLKNFFGSEPQNPAASNNVEDMIGFSPVVSVVRALVNDAADRGPLNEQQFHDLEIEQTELLADRQEPLTEDEAALLRADPSSEDMYNKYLALRALIVENCSVLQDRLARDNTILMFKQYWSGDQWLPVPGTSHIFDRASLHDSLVGAPAIAAIPATDTTPATAARPAIVGSGHYLLTRENVRSPSPYENHETRYRFHRYYVGEQGVGMNGQVAEVGLSQEFNLVMRALRSKLPALQEQQRLREHGQQLSVSMPVVDTDIQSVAKSFADSLINSAVNAVVVTSVTSSTVSIANPVIESSNEHLVVNSEAVLPLVSSNAPIVAPDNLPVVEESQPTVVPSVAANPNSFHNTNTSSSSVDHQWPADIVTSQASTLL